MEKRVVHLCGVYFQQSQHRLLECKGAEAEHNQQNNRRNLSRMCFQVVRTHSDTTLYLKHLKAESSCTLKGGMFKSIRGAPFTSTSENLNDLKPKADE